jgi:hypothetical protein
MGRSYLVKFYWRKRPAFRLGLMLRKDGLLVDFGWRYFALVLP